MARYLQRDGSAYFLVSEEDENDVLGPMTHDQAEMYAFIEFCKIRDSESTRKAALSVLYVDDEGVQSGDDQMPEEYQKAFRLLLAIIQYRLKINEPLSKSGESMALHRNRPMCRL